MSDAQLNRLYFGDAEFLSDPYPTYRHLRASDPVHQSPWGDWYLTSYDGVATLLGDPRFRGQPPAGRNPLLANDEQGSPFGQMMGRWMVFVDPPDHPRLRNATSRYFTKARLDSLHAVVAGVVDDLLGRLRDAETIDLVDDLAYPLPARVAAKILGMPESDHARFRAIFLRLLYAMDSGELSEDESEPIEELIGYFQDLADERRRKPRQDMISLLVETEGRDDGVPEDYVLPTCIFLLWAAQQNSSNLIANAVWTLMRHPAQLETLRRDPGKVPAAVEEVLRFESPMQKVCRWTAEEVELGGKVIPKDQFVIGVIGAAHRDPERFEDPDRFDIAREGGSHLAFGRGAHRCLGIALARMEGQIALERLLRDLPPLEPAWDAIEWQESTSFRGLRNLPVSFSSGR